MKLVSVSLRSTMLFTSLVLLVCWLPIGDAACEASRALRGTAERGLSKKVCKEFLTAYRDTIQPGTNTRAGVQEVFNYNVYSDASHSRNLGTIQEQLTYVGGGDCIGQLMFTFYDGTTTQTGQISSPFTCNGKNNPLTGGWGAYAGLNGFLEFKDPTKAGYYPKLVFYECE
jgi:hypothetical protein